MTAESSFDNLKRLGVIGDVHCEDAFLSLAIRTLHAEGYPTIVCTGDIPTGLGDINACCTMLRQNQIRTVRGNHDRWLIALTLEGLPWATPPSVVKNSSWRFLESLPVTIDLPTPQGKALLCHGIGEEDMSLILPEQSDWELDEHPDLYDVVQSRKYRWMINGHSHHRMVRTYKSLTIINAGTLRRDHQPCFAGIDFENNHVTYWDILDRETAIPANPLSI